MAKSRESKVSHRKRLVDLLGSSGHSTTSRPTKYGLASADSFRDSDLPIKTDVPWPNPTLTTDDPKHSGTDKAYKSNAPVLSKLRSSKVTYARQRSFLGDPTSMASSEHRGIPVTLLQSRGAGQTCTTHLNDRPTSVSDDEEDGNPRPVRSIYELRQAGDNARFRESVEAIFEDIEDSSNSPSGTWSSLAQLCVKLSEPAFVRRFSEHGFNERLIRCMASNKDIVSASLALCAFRLIYLDASSSYTSLRSFWVKLLWLSPELLTNNDSILSLSASRATNLSQTVQRTLKKALGQISSVIIDRQVSPQLSPCLVTLSCIHFCLATFLIKGDRIGAIPAPLLNQIIELPLSQSEKSNGSVSPDGSQLMEAAFLVLETYTMLSGVLGYEQPYSFRLLFQHHDRFIGFDQNDRNHQISTLYTRVILNLTNNHPSLCEEMANPEMVFNFVKIATAEFPDVPEDSSKDENNSFNAVILALGILINLTEQSEMSRASFLKPAQNDMSLLQLLLQHFSAGLSYVKQMGSVSDVHYNVVIGYLSIVLVTLCLNQDAFSLIKVSMGGRGLTLILSTAEEFLQHHQMVEQDSHNFRFVEHHFVESYYPTIENTFSRIIKYNGQDYATEIVDTAGQDEYSILNSKHFIGIHGYIIAYSVASRQSFDMVRVIRDKILNHLGADHVPLVIVGNKSDLKVEQRQVSPDEGRQLGEEFDCAFTEASARLDYNVAKSFDLMIGEIERSQNPSQPTGGNKCVVM
ncbi:ras-domain-containing protein [Aspergillus heteromorphus CBS 117.55]|uniref:Ras-domain-containing protein n=1 Tax=Aspergillus heteromorphus CBS 117.55 TaxID=1448321 RepID=A0A317UP29_9EURO|nr:ras-domain-containing protein [Aspergillus heteromorphus CBS 117.55]PWY63704.1 ras-domain-containing protein [Aspergillus heteromorphus CBS 117.55]